MYIPESRKRIERVKDILIVVLFLTMVLLLCFFWKSDFVTEGFEMPLDLISREAELNVPDINDVIQPEILVGFGTTGSYAVHSDEEGTLWRRALKQMVDLGKSESLLVEEITPQQYKQVMELRSIQFKLDYDIPFSDFIKENGIKRFQALEFISGIGTLAYSEGSKESIFIHQNKGDKYYRIISNQKSFPQFSSMINELEAGSYVTYYPSDKYFGVDTDKLALLPLSIQSNLLEIPYKAETPALNKEKVLEMAESFFGESFDFVRKMTDSKSRTIYMYGYGQKTFTINNNGAFEYKEENDDTSTASLDFYDSLNTALRFVSAHGDWKSLDGSQLFPYLKNVETLESERKKGYRFTFGMKLEDYEVEYEAGDPVKIEIWGKQVTAYSRNLIHFDDSVINALRSAAYRDTFPAVNVVAVNYEYIDKLYSNKTKNKFIPAGSESDGSFESVAEAIEDIKIGYVKKKDLQEQTVVPVWILTLPGVDIYFDLYTADPIGHRYQ